MFSENMRIFGSNVLSEFYLTFLRFSCILSYRFNLYNYISRTSRLTSLVLSY